jgi:DHA1 family bicyclomycin/chloramphenicol resistance-like MFS transporter
MVMLSLTTQATPLAFMLPIFMSSIGFAWILGAAAGKALAPFGDKAGTAAALLGLFQMSGSGLVVGTVQRLGMEPQVMIATLMLIVTPALMILWSKSGKTWHHATA